MTVQISTLRPGYLVSLKTSVKGNVSYVKETLEAPHIESGVQRAAWRTERTIADPAEHKRANQVRMKTRAIICSTCAVSAFGLLCPDNAKDKLDAAVAEARKLAAAFNRRANVTQVTVHVIAGRVARDDVEAVRAINSEVRDLMRFMSQGIKELDAKAVRDAANRARNLGAMLSPEAAEKIKSAIEAARSAARKITKAGENAAQEIDAVALKTISVARTAFLDMDDNEEVVAPVATEGRGVDFAPAAEAGAEEPPHAAAKPTKVARAGAKKKFTGKQRKTKPKQL